MKTAILYFLCAVCASCLGHAEVSKLRGGSVAVTLENLSGDQAEVIFSKLYHGRYTFKSPDVAKLADGLRAVRNEHGASPLLLRIPDGAKVSLNEEMRWIYISWPRGESSYHSILLSYDDLAALSERLVVKEVALTEVCYH
jgi:hypothetical protein